MAALGLQSCQPEELSRFRDDQRKPDREKAASSEEKAETKKCHTNSQQQERLSRFKDVRSKPDRGKVAASDKDVESKKGQGH